MAAYIYQCNHCRHFAEAASRPSPLGCPQRVFHCWHKLAPACPAISTYCRRHRPPAPPAPPLRALASHLPLIAQTLATLQAKRHARQKSAQRTPGILMASTSFYIDPDHQSHQCSAWLAAKLDPHGDHHCGPLFLKLFLRMLSTGVQPHHTPAAKFYLAALGQIDCAQAKITALADSPSQCPGIVITLSNWGSICIANTVDAYGRDKTQKCVTLFNEQLQPPNLHRLLYLTPNGEALESPENLPAPYFRISYRKHIRQWIAACVQAAPDNTTVTASLRQFQQVVYAITEGRFLWEHQYMQSIEQLVLQTPVIIAGVNDLQQAVANLRDAHFHRYWAAVRRDLAGAGITIGELDWHSRFNVTYWPVSIGPTCPVKPRGHVKPKIWRSPLDDKMHISLTLPKHEGDVVARIINAGNRNGWLNATELPHEFSNDMLIHLIRHPEALEKLTAQAVAAIQQFIQRVQSLRSKPST